MKEVSVKLKRCIRVGRHDAIIALMMALAPNLEALKLWNFDADKDNRGSLIPREDRWLCSRFSEEADFQQMFFRGAANSQLAALATSDS